MNRDFKGVWIPKEIWLDKRLTIIDKALLAEINSLSIKKGCFATNNYFSEFLQISTSTITRSLNKLKHFNLIREKIINGRGRILIIIDPSQIDETPSQIDETPSQIDETPSQIDEHINIITNTITNPIINKLNTKVFNTSHSANDKEKKNFISCSKDILGIICYWNNVNGLRKHKINIIDNKIENPSKVILNSIDKIKKIMNKKMNSFENKNKKYSFSDIIRAIDNFTLAATHLEYFPRNKSYYKKFSLSDFIFNPVALDKESQSLFLKFVNTTPCELGDYHKMVQIKNENLYIQLKQSIGYDKYTWEQSNIIKLASNYLDYFIKKYEENFKLKENIDKHKFWTKILLDSSKEKYGKFFRLKCLIFKDVYQEHLFNYLKKSNIKIYFIKKG